MSYSEQNATAINNWVRTFFAKGAKSDNKMYDTANPETIPLRKARDGKDKVFADYAKTRNDNSGLTGPAQAFRVKTYRQKPGKTPAEVGELIVKQKLRGGNCSEMTWLCCHGFVASKHHIWMVVLTTADHQFCILAEKKPTYNSIGTMKYMKDDEWIIDPWANIVCRPGEFAQRFTEKMAAWTQQGKRIGVPNKENTYDWTAGSNEKYLKGILGSKLGIVHGWDGTYKFK